MATLYIAEYQQLTPAPPGAQGQFQMEPPIAQQTVAIGASSTQSAAFNPLTRFVRLHTDAICSVNFGTNQTAAATNARMAANTTELHGVPVNQAFKVAVITNT